MSRRMQHQPWSNSLGDVRDCMIDPNSLLGSRFGFW
ncbi:MAG: hypothetical protein K0Q46_5366, partial [Rhodococcus erythropolis]|nr:hypothetical protein [Rhodococcus erythropolis]